MVKRTRTAWEDPPTNLSGYDPTRDADGFDWSPVAAEHAVSFFADCLTLTSGKTAGERFNLQKWQADLVATLFGWKRNDERKTRRYREAGLFVPRKNGKTETAAGLALYMLSCDKEQAGQVYSAAYSKEQATLVFEPAARMAKNSPLLSPRFRVIDSQKRIIHSASHSIYRAIPAESANSHGFSASAVFFDELHTQRNRELYDVLKTSMGFRTQPLFMSMSTAGHDRHSICFDIWQHARAVRDGIIPDPHFLPVIYEFREGDDWQDVDVWRRVNPSLDVTISMAHLQEEFQRAKDSPSFENTFRNLHLNEWTEQAVRWFSMESWDAGNSELPNLEGEQCWAGLDMSSTTDVTAFVLTFRLSDDRFAVLPHFWIPEDNARQRERTDRVPYRMWADKGFVTMTPGNVVDYDRVRRDINALGERFDIREIGADRWNATQIITQLEGDGFTMFAHGQGYASMSGPSKEFEKLVLGRQVVHGGNPVLRWMASNVSVDKDAADNIKPVKDKSTGRIDGIVAAIMAVGRAVTESNNRCEGPLVIY